MASSEGSGESARRAGPALEAMYRFVLWLIPTVDKFPRRQKFLLGDRMQATALDVLERLIEAAEPSRETETLPGRPTDPGCRSQPFSGSRIFLPYTVSRAAATILR